MTAVRAEAGQPADAAWCEGFEIGYTTKDGVECRMPLTEAWAVPFETGTPVRRFTSRKGQRHLPGLWWSATVGGHVGFESWLERDHVMLLDFDPTVVGIVSQPFWLHWREETGRPVAHVPDYFARRADGSSLVIDCRPVDRRPPRDVAKFGVTARACAVLEWEYRLVGAPEEIVTANVRWLAGSRHPRHRVPGVAEVLGQVFSLATPLLAGARAVGDPIAVLPVLFHLLWRHELTADLSTSLGPDTVVTGEAAAGR